MKILAIVIAAAFAAVVLPESLAQADSIRGAGPPPAAPVVKTTQIDAPPKTGGQGGVRNPSAPFEPVTVTFPDKKRTSGPAVRTPQRQPMVPSQTARRSWR